jgi:SAM-dependent methyltransferase
MKGTNMSVQLATPDYTAIKTKQQATWGSGDYSVVGTTLPIVGETLCEAADIAAGEQVIDVAAGNGNATLAAARRYADVTSTDYVPALLERGEERAVAERLTVAFNKADAENLPYEDGAFDVAISIFGVMFTPDQEKAAQELSRVVRKGGRIALANWTSEGFIGQLFKTLGKHLPPPAGVKSPALWGSVDRLRELFPRHEIRAEKRMFNFRYRSSAHWLQVFKSYYGPTHKAFLALDPDKAAALEVDILGLLAKLNRGKGSLIVPSEYLEAVITKN